MYGTYNSINKTRKKLKETISLDLTEWKILRRKRKNLNKKLKVFLGVIPIVVAINI